MPSFDATALLRSDDGVVAGIWMAKEDMWSDLVIYSFITYIIGFYFMLRFNKKVTAVVLLVTVVIAIFVVVIIILIIIIIVIIINIIIIIVIITTTTTMVLNKNIEC